MNLNHKRGKKIIASILTLCMMLSMLPTVFGASNNSSTKPTGGWNTSGDFDKNYGGNSVNQGIKFSLVFLEIENIDSLSPEERLNLWTTNRDLVVHIGKPVYVAKTDVKVDTVSWTYPEDIIYYENYARSRVKVGENTFKYTTTLGMDNDSFPRKVTFNEGLSLKEYFLYDKMANGVPVVKDDGTPVEGATKNFEALVKYIASTAGINMLFDEQSTGSSSESVFDQGRYAGKLGEYKLICEPFYFHSTPSGRTAFTLRDAVNCGDSKVVSQQHDMYNKMAYAFQLVKDDILGMKAGGQDKEFTSTTQMKTALSANKGIGIGIISSDQMRIPSTRAIASHTNIFIDSEALGESNPQTASIEYLGKILDMEVISKANANLLAEAIGKVSAIVVSGNISGAAQVVLTMITDTKSTYTFGDVRKVLSEAGLSDEEINKIFISAVGEQATDKNIQDALKTASYSEIKYKQATKTENLMAQAVTYRDAKKIFKSGEDAATKSDIEKISEDKVKTEPNVHGAKPVTAVSGTVESERGQGPLTATSKEELEKVGQVSVSRKYTETIDKAKTAKTQVPITLGSTQVKIFDSQNPSSTVGIPKGYVKDIIDDVLADMSVSISDSLKDARKSLTDGVNTDGVVTIKDDVVGYGVAQQEEAVMNWLMDGSGAAVFKGILNVQFANAGKFNNMITSKNIAEYFFPVTYGSTQNFKYSMVTKGEAKNACYGVADTSGQINSINIEDLGINHMLEAALYYAPSLGRKQVAVTAFEEYQSKGTRQESPPNIELRNMGRVALVPSRWLSQEKGLAGNANSSITEKLSTQEMMKKVETQATNESQHYTAVDFARMQNSAMDITVTNENGSTTGDSVFTDMSKSMLEVILPKVNSKIADANWARIQMNGNYGVAYTIWDTGIPVDVVLVAKDKNGGIVPLLGNDAGDAILGVLPNVYYVPSSIEKNLGIPESWTIPLKNGEKMTVKPSEAVVKPAGTDMGEFMTAYDKALKSGSDSMNFSAGEVSIKSIIKKAPFNGEMASDYRTLIPAGTENAGAPTSAKKIVGAVTVVASENDKATYLNDDKQHMALILTVEFNNTVNQYNVIDVIDKDGNKTTTVQTVPPKYSDDEKSVILEPSIDGANQTEWKTSTEDKTPEKWEDVTPLPPVKESNTPTDSIPQTKDDDDTIYVHYVKTDNPEEIKSDLYLPERRISWLKSLKDIGGVPTISFTWPAITGSETHYCGSKHCSGHSCTEGTGSDTFFRFVCSNTTAVASQIMGNKVGFMPFDTNNVYEMNRGKSGGTKTMTPDYGFVIWRGKDIPTIASYKYGDVTGDGKAPGAPVIKSLIGEAQTGIKQVGSREASYNNKFYMDSFTITEGKSNYDTGNLREFVNEFGGNQSTADGQFDGVLSQFHDVSTKYKIAVGEAEVAKDRMDEDKTYLDSTHEAHDERYSSHSRGEYSNCSTCREVQGIYDASKKNYDDKVKVRDELKVTYDALATKLGQTKTNAIEKHVGDYDYNTHWSYCGKESWGTASGNSQTFNPQVRVDVGFGTENTGNKKVSFKSTNLNAFGKEYKNVTGFPINNTKTINFWPYVNMVYDTTMGLVDQNVYVLGGHESKFLPQDYVEIGYLPVSANSETTTGLVMQSKQWSTHQSAIKLAGGIKNKVLPGGAIYRLTTPGAGTGSSTATTIAVSSWLTFLPSDTINATTAGKDVYNGTAQNNKNEGLYRQVLNSLNSLDIVQVVGGTQVLQELAGTQKVSGTSGQPTSKDAKYWLKQNIKDGTGNASVPASNDAAMKINSVKPNEADLDVTNTKEERIYYRIYSNTNGEVFVSKSTTSAADTAPGKGTVIGKITKAQGLADLLKVDEVKALNNRTNVVENYLNSIDRNIGNDKELAAKGQDAKWYNEAFDGICVVRINKQIEVGFKDGNMAQAARTAAIDPKLEPVRKSQADLFKSKVDSWFETDKHTNLSDEAGYVGTFTNKESGAPDTKITIQNMNGIYKSKVFLIPNASVTDLY